MAAIGTGAVVAAIVVGRTRPAREPGRTAYAGVLLLGLATLTFGLVHGILAAVMVGVGFGFGQQLAELLWTTGLQHNVPGGCLAASAPSTTSARSCSCRPRSPSVACCSSRPAPS